MKYGVDYYGYVYLWFDTKHKKFIIGSHHGSVNDNYKRDIRFKAGDTLHYTALPSLALQRRRNVVNK
jgi:hypothetical protein